MTDWRPISTAPVDGTGVILFDPLLGIVGGAFLAAMTEDGDDVEAGWEVSDFVGGELRYDADPTHWMPLPEAPPPWDEPA